MLDGAFDVAEMSFATFLKAFELGRDLIGLPLFTGRGFLQPGLICSTKSGIGRPEELAGKRVGVPQFWMTSSVWHRGVLEQQHGVKQDQINWLTASEERFENLVFPKGVSVERLPESVSFQDALSQGLVDATMSPPRGAPKSMNPAIASPYADLAQAERDYYAATNVFPIMHFVVMKKSLNAELPWLGKAVVDAFAAAKQRAAAAGALGGIIPGVKPEEERRLLGDDPWAFGLEANKAAVGAFFGFAHGQHWVPPSVNVESCFLVPST
jgi:4,5-dihydroxyphthalate decarboxylase